MLGERAARLEANLPRDRRRRGDVDGELAIEAHSDLRPADDLHVAQIDLDGDVSRTACGVGLGDRDGGIDRNDDEGHGRAAVRADAHLGDRAEADRVRRRPLRQRNAPFWNADGEFHRPVGAPRLGEIDLSVDVSDLRAAGSERYRRVVGDGDGHFRRLKRRAVHVTYAGRVESPRQALTRQLLQRDRPVGREAKVARDVVKLAAPRDGFDRAPPKRDVSRELRASHLRIQLHGRARVQAPVELVEDPVEHRLKRDEAKILRRQRGGQRLRRVEGRQERRAPRRRRVRLRLDEAVRLIDAQRPVERLAIRARVKLAPLVRDGSQGERRDGEIGLRARVAVQPVERHVARHEPFDELLIQDRD